MQTGNISAAVWDRCFGHRVITSGGGRLDRDSFWKDRDGSPFAVTRSVGGKYDLLPEMIIAEAVNRSFLKSVNDRGFPGTGLKDRRIPAVSGISVHFLLAGDTTEEMLSERMDRIVRFCRRTEIDIVSADAAVSDAVLRDVMTVSVRTEYDALENSCRPVPDRKAQTRIPEGCSLYLAGCCGDAGISILADVMKEHLKKRFSSAFTEHAGQFGKNLLCRELMTDLLLQKHPEEMCEDASMDRILAYPVGEGGAFAAFWHFCRLFQTGARIDPRSIPIHQETIEICEYLGLQPYQLYTCQAVLFAAPSGEDWPGAVRIGETARGPACILGHGEEEVRYLEKPQTDGLMLLATGN